MFGTLINAAKQVRNGTLNEAKLDAELAAKVAVITVNETAIANIIASKAVAGGIATLGLDGYVLPNQLRAAGIAEYKGEVTTLAALTSVADADRGDVVDVVPFMADGTTPDTENAQSFFLFGDDPTVAADWKPVRSPKDGVISLRNASGSTAGLNGVVTLADVALNGLPSSLVFSNADFTAEDVDAALVELMAKAKGADVSIADINTALADKLDAAKLKFGQAMVGTIDQANKTFSVGESFVAGSLQVYFGGQRLRDAIDYTITANDVEFTQSPDFETERPFCDYIAAA